MKNNHLRIIAVQINPTIGDIDSNTQKIINYIISVQNKYAADIIVFPEMGLTGYYLEDLLLYQETYNKIKDAISRIQLVIKNTTVILGIPCKQKNIIYNSAIIIKNNIDSSIYHKQSFSNDMHEYNEKKYFSIGNKNCFFKIKNCKIALFINHDVLSDRLLKESKQNYIDLIICISACPFDNQIFKKEQLLCNRAKKYKMTLLNVNMVGGQDATVFYGGSLLINYLGKIVARAEFFKEDLIIFNHSIPNVLPLKINNEDTLCKKHPLKLIYNALVLGVRDYIEKNKFPGIILGISGGIDSALTLAIASDAIGAKKVNAVYLPSRYSSELSEKISEDISYRLKVSYKKISIDNIFESFLKDLVYEYTDLPSIVIQNLQARCRAVILFELSNITNNIVLSTSNKSEIAVGYTTLYGDMVGGFAVLKDIYKTLVYQLANYRNKISSVIPVEAITRDPSAELIYDQKDTDDLPPYTILDQILTRYIDFTQSREEIINSGFEELIVNKVIKLVKNSEYKRRQAPLGIRISPYVFGETRKYPVTFND